MIFKLSWYFSRLLSMSFAEVVYRVKQQFQKYYEFLFFRKDIDNIVEIPKLPRKLFFDVPNEFNIEFNESKYPIFTNYIDITQKIDWHKDISTGKKFPLKFSKFINVRDDQYGNAKYVWEVNRLNFLLYFALKFAQESHNKKFFLQRIIDIINDWKQNNPYLIGVNWYSNIEVNIRLIVFVFVWDIIDASNLVEENKEFKKFVNTIWLPLVYKHCEFSYNNPSKFSSANNHLIAEGAGLYIASLYWDFDKSEQWRKYAKNILEQEIVKQHSENGVNKEEAAEYIQFITDFFLLSYVLGTRKGDMFSDSFVERLKNIFEYIYNFTDCNVNFPKYGDEDDGRVINLDFNNLENSNNFSSLLLSAAILFDNEKFSKKSKKIDLKNYLMFGQKVYHYPINKNIIQESNYYSKEGHFFIRNYKKGKEIFAHFNAAPLGYLSIAAHGHSDALSFSINIDGQEVFVDSGTYTYHSDRKWRDYFIGTLAHNTVRIDRGDQAISKGPLLWHKHYSIKILKNYNNIDKEIIIAEHNGYNNIGCIHKRKFEFDKNKFVFTVSDDIEVFDNNEHYIEIPFHLHPSVSVIEANDGIKLSTKDFELLITVPLNLQRKIVNGSLNPVLGWYSERFYKKVKTNVIYLHTYIKENTNFTTNIYIKHK